MTVVPAPSTDFTLIETAVVHHDHADDRQPQHMLEAIDHSTVRLRNLIEDAHPSSAANLRIAPPQRGTQ